MVVGAIRGALFLVEGRNNPLAVQPDHPELTPFCSDAEE